MAEGQGVFAKANRRTLLYCSVFVFGAILYGYDGTYFTGILAMETFLKAWGHPDPSAEFGYQVSAGDQSLYASIVQVGEVIGSLSAGFIGDKFGRKGAMRFSICLVTIGTIIQLPEAGSKPLLVVGRLILGSGVGIISNCVTLYLSEISPVAIRGTMVSSWQLFLALGQVLGAGVAQGTKDYTSTFSWRFPIALNIGICLIIFAGLFFVPESPRWLLSKDRIDEATVALQKIHHGEEDYYPDREVQVQLDAKAAEAKESGGESRWVDLFKGAQRKKLFGAFGILCCQQINGVQFVFSYGTVFFDSIGIEDAFLITMVTDIVEVVGVLCSFFIVNRYGRRPLLIWSAFAMFVLMLIAGCLGIVSNEDTYAINSAIAAMIIIFVFVFNLAWGGLAWVVATELASGKNRTKIMGVATAGFWICAWAVTFTLPYLYNDDAAGLGPMTCFIYAGGAAIGVAFVFFYIPETFGRSLEEINMMLELHVPTRSWPQYRTTIDDVPAEEHKAEGKGNRFGNGTNKGEFLEDGAEKGAALRAPSP